VLKCKPIGVLELAQSEKGREERNDRIFATPDRSPFEDKLQDIRHLPQRAIKELEGLFQAINALESKSLKFKGWQGPRKAIRTIKKLSE
jgi:inorganic pyrophosphatase